MMEIFFPVLIGIGLSFLLEFLCLWPRSIVSIRRSKESYLLHVLSWLTLYGFFFLIYQRPWFSASLVSCFHLLLLAVNFAKYHSLKEPFLLQDFEYFLDLIRHPRLYLPFFGIWNAIAGSLIFSAIMIVGLTLESTYLQFYSLKLAFFLSVVIWLLLWVCKKVALLLDKPLLDPDRDVLHLGLVAFFWSYYTEFTRQPALQENPRLKPFVEADLECPLDQPDLVVIQSESFFDPRKSYNCILDNVLKEYDDICQSSFQYGMLSVPAWGANTVRTECAFLTGLKPDDLGIYQFNPYWYLAKNNLLNLASVLKSRGYHTVCIHPYSSGFYLRDKVFPRLGFDQFIDIDHFDSTQKDGQYISDKAVAEKIRMLLDGVQEKPIFIFSITMENHGPLHLESASELDWRSFYKERPPKSCDDLTIYLRHLMNADQMLKELTNALVNRDRKSLLCWYGDHVPVMSSVYKQLGEPVDTPPYLLWSSDQIHSETISKSEDVSDLPEMLLRKISGHYGVLSE